ncbi:competence pheromone ComX [Metasolibacillus sp. FSL H7-0170]|uniref:competence pheromone ComX n=1 Tax=Metasolibacillus TaxID=2703677 RepID=UPI000D3825D1|nr:competence pheromone ComX [Metasolibacillus fluoroglycofenilyticus]
MISKLIKYVKENSQLIPLLEDNKLSLLGVSKWEQQAIVEAMNEPMKALFSKWR